MSPGIRGNLRPDLRDAVLELDATSTLDLKQGQTATLRVERVLDAGHPEDVLVTGLWTGPDGCRGQAEVLVHAAALPAKLPRRGEQASQRPDLYGQVLDLDHTTMRSLRPGQRLQLQVVHVGDEAEWVPVRGWPVDKYGRLGSDMILVFVRGPALPEGTPQ